MYKKVKIKKMDHHQYCSRVINWIPCFTFLPICFYLSVFRSYS